MHLSELLNDADPCELARRWTLDPSFAAALIRLVRMSSERLTPAGFGGSALQFRIISGFRSRETQARVNPLTPNSCHVRCPAVAADLSMGSIEGIDRITPHLWAVVGGIWEFEFRGRWGGNFDVGPGLINEAESNHFDWGPC